jgi:hypothetical protein
MEELYNRSINKRKTDRPVRNLPDSVKNNRRGTADGMDQISRKRESI